MDEGLPFGTCSLCEPLFKDVEGALRDTEKKLELLVKSLSADLVLYGLKVEELVTFQIKNFKTIVAASFDGKHKFTNQHHGCLEPDVGSAAYSVLRQYNDLQDGHAIELGQPRDCDIEGPSPFPRFVSSRNDHLGSYPCDSVLEEKLASNSVESAAPSLWQKVGNNVSPRVSVTSCWADKPTCRTSAISRKSRFVSMRHNNSINTNTASIATSVLRGGSREAQEARTRAAYDAALLNLKQVQPVWQDVAFVGRRWRQKNTPSGRLVNVVQSSIFSMITAFLIVTNSCYIGIRADHEMKVALFHLTSESSVIPWNPLVFTAIDVFFDVVFSVELLMRMFALKSHFWFARGWKWNVFDVVVVVTSATETAFQGVKLDTGFARLLRLMRMIRTIEVVGRVRGTSKLRLMLLAIFESVISLFWAMALLVAFMYLFAVIFLQASAVYLESGTQEEMPVEVLTKHFSSLPMALLTLGMSISGGINWWEIEEAFLSVSPLCSCLFIVYVALMILALLNIVTGIFVNDSIEVAQSDRELRTLAIIQDNAERVSQLRKLFGKIDTDDSGMITLEEFQNAMMIDEVRLALQSLGVDTMNATGLFRLLDVNGDTTLEIEEFVIGCNALAVSARSLDMELLKAQNSKVLKTLRSLQDRVEMLALSETDDEFGSGRSNFSSVRTRN